MAMAAVATAGSLQSHLHSPHSLGAIGALTKRSGSVPGSARGTACSSETDAVPLFKKHLEATEEKLSVQIGRVQQQNEKLREAAFSRVDAKLCGFEALQPKIDRRLAELSGNLQGLSSELQVQIRRADQMDSRLRSWKQELEDTIDARFAELERSFQQIESSARLSSSCSEDSINRWSRRLLRLEGLVDERTAAADDVNQSLLNLHARLSQIEEAAPMPSHSPPQVETNAVATLESQFADAMFKLQRWHGESQDLHIRVEAQEERLKSLRTLMDSKDECVRTISDRVERADWDGHLKELQDQLTSLEQRCRGIELELCHKAKEKQLLAVEEEVRGYVCRLGKLEQLEAPELARHETISNIRELLEQLKEVAPKVIEHEALLRQLIQAQVKGGSAARSESRSKDCSGKDVALDVTSYVCAAAHFIRCEGPTVRTLWRRNEEKAVLFWKAKPSSELLEDTAAADAEAALHQALSDGLSTESLAEGLALALARFKLSSIQIEPIIQSSLDQLGESLERGNLSEEEFDVTCYRNVFIAASDELRRKSLIS